MFGILKLNNVYGMLLRALLLAVVMSFMAVGAAEAQEKKPRKKLKQLLCMADSLRKELVDRCCNGATPSSWLNWTRAE